MSATTLHKRKFTLFHDPDFTTRFFTLAIPLVIQSLLNSSLSFFDTLMVGQLGETAIAAVGLGNQLLFFTMLFFFGISSGVSILIAQFWGKKNVAMIHRVMGLGYTIAITGSVLFTLIALTVPELVLRIFTPDPLVIEQGSTYLRTVGASYLFLGPACIIEATFKSTENMKIPTISTAISLTTNCIGNAVLIFGLGPFPELGIMGAAIATVFARALHLTILLTISYRRSHSAPAINTTNAGSASNNTPQRMRKHISGAPLSAMMHFHKPLVKKFIVVALPVLAHELCWSMGMMVYKAVYARMGTNILASINIAEGMANLFFIVAVAIAHSSAVMLGNTLGKGELQQAETYGVRFLKMAFVSGLALMGILMVSAFILPHLVQVTPTSKTYIRNILLIRSFFLPIMSFNITLFISILRSGGDTKAAFLIENSAVWLWGVPVAFLAGLVLQLPIYWVVALVWGEDLIKMSLGVWRVKSGKWLNDLTDLGDS